MTPAPAPTPTALPAPPFLTPMTAPPRRRSSAARSTGRLALLQRLRRRAQARRRPRLSFATEGGRRDGLRFTASLEQNDRPRNGELDPAQPVEVALGPVVALEAQGRGAARAWRPGGGPASDRRARPRGPRTRSRIASSAGVGTRTGCRPPIISSRTSRSASRRSVLTRSCAGRSILPGAAMVQPMPLAASSRASPKPVGPASYATRTGAGRTRPPAWSAHPSAAPPTRPTASRLSLRQPSLREHPDPPTS